MTNLSTYIAGLETYSVKELQKIWSEYFDCEPEQVSKVYLIRRIAYRVQELKYGGLQPEIIKILSKNLRQAENDSKNKSKIKIGAVITRIYKGIEFKVTVVNEGYEFNGMFYRSLTKIAALITGSKTSGPLFFGIKE